jgi:hypothetical protein
MNEEKTPLQNQKSSGKFLRNVLIKGILLFIIVNFAVALVPPGNHLSRMSLYNRLFPGRVRLPFGENPQEAYNLSLYDLDAMFASHEIAAGPKPDDEFRIILIGDSATWGTLLQPEDTLSGLINADAWQSCDGRRVRAYNLAYPTMSLTKDLMILEAALAYEPDLILWPITLESFPDKVQFDSPIVANNPQRVVPLIENFHLSLDSESEAFVYPSLWERTLIGRRRPIFDALRLQFYGVMWSATGIDQTYPEDYTPAQRHYDTDDSFHGWSPPTLPLDRIAVDVISAGHKLAGDIPIVLVNEPIMISDGTNSDIRYNFFYPRWAYDEYRWQMAERAYHADWTYLDLWNIIPQTEFTNSAVHLTPQGQSIYYQALKPALTGQICP